MEIYTQGCAVEVCVVGATLRQWNWSRVGKFCVLGAWVLLEIDWQLEAVVGKPQTRSEAWGKKKENVASGVVTLVGVTTCASGCKATGSSFFCVCSCCKVGHQLLLKF